MNSGKNTLSISLYQSQWIHEIYIYIFLLEKRISTISRWFAGITRLVTCFKRHYNRRWTRLFSPSPISCNRSKSHYGTTYLCRNFEKKCSLYSPTIPRIGKHTVETRLKRRKRPRIRYTERIQSRRTHTHVRTRHRCKKWNFLTASPTVLKIKIFLQKEKEEEKKERKKERKKRTGTWRKTKRVEKRGKKSWKKKRRGKKENKRKRKKTR